MIIENCGKYRKVIQLELNEITYACIQKMISEGHLPNFKKMMSRWKFYKTTSEIAYEHLEPWIQWVTAHTRKTFSEHNIFHLGDASDLSYPQIWEVLSNKSVESYIFGSMNAVRGKDTKGGIFFPDPWHKNPDNIFPDELGPLWRAISKHVQSYAHGIKVSMNDVIQVIITFFKYKLPFKFYLNVIRFILQKIMRRKVSWKLAGLFDQFLFYIFKHILKKSDKGFFVLFLNSVAHYQHHYWRNFDKTPFNQDIQYDDCSKNDNPIAWGMKNFDKMIGEIIALKEPDTLIIIVSALSQEPYTKSELEGGMNYYRLKNLKKFCKLIQIDYKSVYPLMSRDWQIEFSNEGTLHKGEKILNSITVGDKQLFNINKNAKNTLFVETKISNQLSKEAAIYLNDRKIAEFWKVFTKTAVKSGSHISEGCLWVSEEKEAHFPESQDAIPLAEVFNLPLDALL